MSAEMRCPRCGSTDVECQPKRPGRVHMHYCHSCGYDGTTPLPDTTCQTCGSDGYVERLDYRPFDTRPDEPCPDCGGHDEVHLQDGAR